METPSASAPELEAALERALEPMRAELRSLREEIVLLRAELIAGRRQPAPAQAVASTQAPAPAPVAPVAAPPAPAAQAEAAPPVQLDVPVATEIPAERSDFARMLQRGLAQEAAEHAFDGDDREAADKRKRGWNPFRR